MKAAGFQEKVLLFFNRSLVLITKKLNPQRIDLENRAGEVGPAALWRGPQSQAHFHRETRTQMARGCGRLVEPGETLAYGRDALALGLFSLEMKI